jgi:hypothetical protein
VAEREERLRKRAEMDAAMGELRRLLAGVPVRAVMTYLAERLGCGRGQWRVEFQVAEGSVRYSFVHRGPMRNEELEELGRE